MSHRKTKSSQNCKGHGHNAIVLAVLLVMLVHTLLCDKLSLCRFIHFQALSDGKHLIRLWLILRSNMQASWQILQAITERLLCERFRYRRDSDHTMSTLTENSVRRLYDRSRLSWRKIKIIKKIYSLSRCRAAPGKPHVTLLSEVSMFFHYWQEWKKKSLAGRVYHSSAFMHQHPSKSVDAKRSFGEWWHQLGISMLGRKINTTWQRFLFSFLSYRDI